jgi:hypothetical protein
VNSPGAEEIPSKLGEKANEAEIAKLVKLGLALRLAHVKAVKEHSVRRAGGQDSAEPA